MTYVARLVKKIGPYSLTRLDGDGRIYVLAPDGRELESFSFLVDAEDYATLLIRSDSVR